MRSGIGWPRRSSIDPGKGIWWVKWKIPAAQLCYLLVVGALKYVVIEPASMGERCEAASGVAWVVEIVLVPGKPSILIRLLSCRWRRGIDVLPLRLL